MHDLKTPAVLNSGRCWHLEYTIGCLISTEHWMRHFSRTPCILHQCWHIIIPYTSVYHITSPVYDCGKATAFLIVDRGPWSNSKRRCDGLGPRFETPKRPYDDSSSVGNAYDEWARDGVLISARCVGSEVPAASWTHLLRSWNTTGESTSTWVPT